MILPICTALALILPMYMQTDSLTYFTRTPLLSIPPSIAHTPPEQDEAAAIPPEVDLALSDHEMFLQVFDECLRIFTQGWSCVRVCARCRLCFCVHVGQVRKDTTFQDVTLALCITMVNDIPD